MNKGDIVLVGNYKEIIEPNCDKLSLSTMPVVMLDGNPCIIAGMCLEYNGYLVEQLSKLSPKEQWKLLCELEKEN